MSGISYPRTGSGGGGGSTTVTGGDNINTNPVGNNYEVNLDQSNLDGQLLISSSVGTASWANLTSSDNSVTITNGQNTIDLKAMGGGSGIETINTISPDGSGDFGIVGGNNVTVTAGTNQITIDATDAVGMETLNSVSPDGSGNVGLTSSDASVTITNGTNSIDLKASGGGGGGIQTINTTSPDGSGDFSASAVSDSGITVGSSANGITLDIAGHHGANRNTYFGVNALNGGGMSSTAVGDSALYDGGDNSVAVGYSALTSSFIGTNAKSVGIGNRALMSGGDNSVAVGNNALSSGGSGSVAVGFEAGYTSASTSIGYKAGSGSTAAPPDGTPNYNIAIGYNVTGELIDFGVTRIGATSGAEAISKCYIGGIAGVPISGDIVTVDANGQLGTSSASFMETLEGVSPDNNGNIDLTSSDSSVTITTSTNTIDLKASGGSSFTWNTVSTNTALQPNTGYISSGTVTHTLPATMSAGDTIKIIVTSGTTTIAQNTGQTINFGSSPTTTGTGGSIASSANYDSVDMVAVSSTDLAIISSVGNWTIT